MGIKFCYLELTTGIKASISKRFLENADIQGLFWLYWAFPAKIEKLEG